MAPEESKDIAVPAMVGFVGAGVAALGFGAGYGARSYRSSVAYKELMEKFPEVPTAEAEALAVSGARRAFLGGTALAALMGIGAVMTARANGIQSANDLGEAIKKWLPSEARLEVSIAHAQQQMPPPRVPFLTMLVLPTYATFSQSAMGPKLGELTRTITEHIQPARDRASAKFKASELGRRMSERAQGSTTQKPLEPWEKELLAKLEGQDAAKKK